MSNLFISHATKDDIAVSELYERLQANHIDAWVDHKNGIGPADNWSGQIHDALNACTMGLLVLSPASAKSEECEAEYRKMMLLGKRVYIALIEPVTKEDFPYRLTVIQYVDLTKDYDTGVQTLVDAIQNETQLDPADKHVNALRPLTARTGVDPRLLIPIFGRDPDLVQIKTYLNSGRPTFITGVGGLGKSRLAYQMATNGADVNGVIWHVCSDASRSEMVMELLKTHFDMTIDTPTDKVLERLRTYKRLIVIDNAESVNDETRQTAYITLINQLSQAGAQVLITSRVKWDNPMLRAHEHTPPPLPLDSAIDVTQAMCDAENVELDDVTQKKLAKLAYQHARLIEFAVTLTKRRGIERVFKTLDSLQGRKVEEALHEMILQTVEQMRDADKEYGAMAEATLKRLTVCRGGFTYPVAQQFAIDPENDTLPQDDDDLDEVLDLLVQWKFARFEPSSNRYEIDSIVIVAVGEDETLHQVHYDLYYALAQEHDNKQDYKGLEIESENLNIAFERKFEAGHYADAYWILWAMGDFMSNRGRFEERREWITALMPYLENSDNEFLKASANLNLGNMYQEYPLGNRRENLQRAIKAYQEVLKYWTLDTAPLDYALTHNNLGNTYNNLAQVENREENLRLAIASYQEALKYQTPDLAPLAYAMTHNNLGAAYNHLSEVENREENLRLAIASYQEALKYRTPDIVPLEYATTHNNLGTAYKNLAQVANREENLRLAIESYQKALKYWTADNAPVDYALTHNNLGTAYGGLAQVENREENLRLAITSYQEALKYWTADNAPLNYARTHYNLGNAHGVLAQVENRDENLRLAIASYQEALTYWIADNAPLDYAKTQRNLGIVLVLVGELPNAIECWREAEKYYRQMGYIEDADLMQGWIDEAQGDA